ncbi:flavin-binding monooxygenase [Xylariomycetidae sp. FL0641]|nr:flavin-binding monooxygenase [Xylariomycetidae sp. FL0641]
MGSSDSSPPFTLKDAPLDGHRPMKVRVIGAGYSGVYLGVRIPQRLRNIDLRIYDKNEQIGGTWWVNKYPGCACDIPSHSYQYSFNPNPNWSAFYAPQKEICAYLQDTAKKFGVTRFVKLQHEVQACKWNDETNKWILTVRKTDTGEVFEDDADVLISARGMLSNPAWPDIPGLSDFKGERMHSSMWNEKYDFRNKRIGVVGNGSSSIQIVPSLQKMEGTQLYCFVRSKTWITNPFGDIVMKKLGLDPKTLEISQEQRDTFNKDPSKLLAFRKAIEADGNTIHTVTFRGSSEQAGAVDAFRAAMRDRLSAKPEIADFLVPHFGVGCRRATPGPGYLEALVESNVEFVPDGITGVTENGVTLKSGRHVELDALVCATGFHASRAPPFPVEGRHDTLEQRFAPPGHASAYLSLAVDGFPNLFMMLGPNSAIGSGSLTTILETEGDYVVKCVRKLQKEDYAAMTVRADRARDWKTYCARYFRDTVYTDACNSWYKSGGRQPQEGEGEAAITGLWPGSTLHAIEALRAPRWEDFDFVPVPGAEGNALRWLGNGYSVTHAAHEGQGTGGAAAGAQFACGDPAWYLEPRFQSIPPEGRPEEDEEFKLRPFSH